jgi:serine/threonine-protein kinase
VSAPEGPAGTSIEAETGVVWTTPGEVGALVGRQLGHYRLEALLGVGGMAEVYRARDPALHRQVAVKVLTAAMATDPGYVRRFRQEAQRVAALRHPHIVPVYHFGADGGRLYLVMPIYRESLRDRLEHHGLQPAGRLGPDDAMRLVSEIASALEAAHAQGLVHRDVKPENILLDESGAALLTDFGIARSLTPADLGRRQTIGSTGLPVGTPEYMAPEQLRNDPVDQRADIYALGAVLYEALSGQAPHEGGSPYEVATLALTAPLVSPARRSPLVWPALEQVILTALARRPEERYQNVASFATALREARRLRDQPVLARERAPDEAELAQAPTLPEIPVAQPPILTRARTALRRPRTLVAIAVTALLVVALVSVALSDALGLANVGAQTIILPGAVVTATPQPGASATVIVGATPSAQATAQSTSLATPAAHPTATSAPLPALTVAPTPLALNPLPSDTHTCSASQTITNNTSQTLGWTWEKPALGGFHFQVNNGPQVGWPSNATPGIAPGGRDTLLASTGCKAQPVSFAVLMTDTLGNQYPFVLQVQ